jgi:hypothetical protein
MTALDAELRPEMIDALMDLYCEWREECTGVHAAYSRFCDVASAERALAYAAYTAALDREGAACQSYAEHIEWVVICLARSQSGGSTPGRTTGGSAEVIQMSGVPAADARPYRSKEISMNPVAPGAITGDYEPAGE